MTDKRNDLRMTKEPTVNFPFITSTLVPQQSNFRGESLTTNRRIENFHCHRGSCIRTCNVREYKRHRAHPYTRFQTSQILTFACWWSDHQAIQQSIQTSVDRRRLKVEAFLQHSRKGLIMRSERKYFPFIYQRKGVFFWVRCETSVQK